jgi:hypothetical protein
MTVSGTYDVSSGTLSIPINGTSSPGTDYGQLAASGAATLGGSLSIQTASGYAPPIGTQYTILKARAISGTFSSVTGSQLANERYALTYPAATVVATVVPTPPTVTGVSPPAGPTAGTTTVTITGTYLSNATAVMFGTTKASSFTVNSATQLTATAPAQPAGTVDVTAATPGGVSATSSSDHYTYGTSS